MKNILKYLNLFSLENEPITLNNIKYFLVYLLLFYCINLLLYYSVIYLIKLDILGIEILKNQQLTYSFQTKIFIITVFLVPITEEIFFRLGIIFSPINASFFIVGVYTSIPYLLIQTIIKSNSVVLIIYFISLIFLFVTSYYILNKTKKAKIFWNNNIRLIITLSIISFAVIHINNYKTSNLPIAILCAPFYLSPYIFSGYYFSLIRIRHGILWSIVAHITTNCISTLYFS